MGNLPGQGQDVTNTTILMAHTVSVTRTLVTDL